MLSAPPLSYLMNCVGICIALAVLTPRSPHAIASFYFSLPKVAQFVRDEMHDIFLVAKLHRPQVASSIVGHMWLSISPVRRAADHYIPRLSTSSAPSTGSVVMTTERIGPPPKMLTILEGDVKARDTAWTTESDHLSEQGSGNLCVILDSHFLCPFSFIPSLIRALTYRVPASKQNSFRRLSSRMPITPRGYSVMTRLGLTPWITEANVFRLTTLDCSSDVMCSPIISNALFRFSVFESIINDLRKHPLAEIFLDSTFEWPNESTQKGLL